MKRFIYCFLVVLMTISCFKTENVKSNRIYYEIFVRSFADSNGDGIGDINGITEKLPELNKIGIEGLWLTPIFKSPSYHKYDVTDYLKIDEEYGTKEDLKKLVEKAHELDIKVIIDFPVNHTSIEHPWFKDILKNPDSKYKDYYNIINKDEKGYNKNIAVLGGKSWHKLNENELYYGIFWEGMPDLDFSNKNVRQEIIKYAKYWLKKTNLDGYRLDAAPHIFAFGEHAKGSVDNVSENIKWWSEFRKELQSVNKNVYLVGEVWSNTDYISKFYEVFDSNFNFEFSEKLIFYTVFSGNSSKIRPGLENIYKKYEKVNSNYIDAIFLTNHDQERVANKIKDTKRLKLIASILLTLPGNPYIYYGEELGMKGSKPDEYIRQGYIWRDKYQTSWVNEVDNEDIKDFYTQEKNENSLLSHYIKWIKIRKENEEIRYGKYESLDLKNDGVFAFKMKYKGKEKAILHNLLNENIKVSLNGKEIELKPYESVVK
ncbi:alpha-amylase family glycosyl hydrolase [Oceanivirga salmonicida]|uniref:alpha-amylase family glycosyl hydrolase n=1 Tax=Oceanivirga salmonicida TaxID=1769291 RepID=UPI0012E0FCBF|nr:alpha-amylase family glycosyl hydrolase [Oceanivirga salmonicida]